MPAIAYVPSTTAKQRADIAAAIIRSGRPSTRRFSACFEHDDGDEVKRILLDRARKSPKLAANIRRYLDISTEQEQQKLRALSDAVGPLIKAILEQESWRPRPLADHEETARHITRTVVEQARVNALFASP
jgi:hypothetical protein